MIKRIIKNKCFISNFHYPFYILHNFTYQPPKLRKVIPFHRLPSRRWQPNRSMDLCFSQARILRCNEQFLEVEIEIILDNQWEVGNRGLQIYRTSWTYRFTLCWSVDVLELLDIWICHIFINNNHCLPPKHSTPVDFQSTYLERKRERWQMGMY